MSQLTDKLKKDHVAILEALTQLKGLGNRHPDFSRKATLAKAALLAHLKHEDDELYPVLKNAAVHDFRIQAKLNVLAKDMESLATVALTFFAKYESDGPSQEFQDDLHALDYALRTRIRREEESLYSLYDLATAENAQKAS